MNEYATVPELKNTLELSGEDFADADLTLALTAASRAVDHVTGRRFWADADVNQVRYYSPESEWQVWIDDLITVTSVEVDTGADQTFEESWTQGTDYLLHPLNATADGRPYTSIKLRSRSARYLPCDDRSVKVTGKFGWAEVPDEVKMATMIVAGKLVKRVREAPFGVVGLGMDGAAVRIASSDPDVALLLADLTRVNFG